MLFMPQEKAKEMCDKVLKESIERNRRRSMERRKKYKKMIENGEL